MKNSKNKQTKTKEVLAKELCLKDKTESGFYGINNKQLTGYAILLLYTIVLLYLGYIKLY